MVLLRKNLKPITATEKTMLHESSFMRDLYVTLSKQNRELHATIAKLENHVAVVDALASSQDRIENLTTNDKVTNISDENNDLDLTSRSVQEMRYNKANSKQALFNGLLPSFRLTTLDLSFMMDYQKLQKSLKTSASLSDVANILEVVESHISSQYIHG